MLQAVSQYRPAARQISARWRRIGGNQPQKAPEGAGRMRMCRIGFRTCPEIRGRFYTKGKPVNVSASAALGAAHGASRENGAAIKKRTGKPGPRGTTTILEDDTCREAQAACCTTAGPRVQRGRAGKAKSISGTRPATISAMARPEPQPMVQPRVPWPVFRYRLLNVVLPTYGTLEGVSGRWPVGGRPGSDSGAYALEEKW